MITIIHGDDIAASRNYFLTQRSTHTNVNVFEGDKLSLDDVMQVFEGGGLFANEKSIFIENLFSSKKAETTEEIIIYLAKMHKGGSIYLWEEKEITKKQLGSFPTAEIKAFKLPQEVFFFLDSLRPSNSIALLKLFHSIIAQKDAEFVFFMLVRQTRLLLALSSQDSNAIDEVKRLAPWQKGKLLKQSGYFTSQQLQDMYKKLFAMDMATKTGTATLSLTQSIDFFLLEL